MSNTPIYPHITVDLSDAEARTYLVIRFRTIRAMEKGGVPLEEREKFLAEVRGKDHTDLIDAVKRWVSTTP